MSVKVEVISKPKVHILEAMNHYYDYEASELSDYLKQCAVTIKQSTY
jgi:hypothetical protein